MVIQRKIYDSLLRWKKESAGKRALLIEGARRVGKSTIAEQFAREQYKSYILIDFNKASKRVRDCFDRIDRLDEFFQELSLEYNTRFYPRDTLIVFDEIQKFPRAREAIKYLVADGRYDFIETGSLISIRENVEDITIPSEERKLRMYPLDFDEFLIAAGEDVLRDYIIACTADDKALEDALHKRAMRLFREYLLVGGMPQSVCAFFDSGRDFYASDVEKRDILELYRDDIKKASKRYNTKLSAIFDNIPGYLSTHEKKVVLNRINRGATYAEYEDPLFWLGDSMICNLCYKTTDPNVGIALNRDDSQVKCYMGDTGLLVSLAFNENEISNQKLYKAIMDGRLSLNEGMLFENMIAQMLKSKGRELYFYTRYSEAKHRNDIEIDFIISNESPTKYKLTPIEVKSGKNYTTTSLSEFNKVFSERVSDAYIVHPKGYSRAENITSMPPYMFFYTI